jgi:hypothetical protein
LHTGDKKSLKLVILQEDEKEEEDYYASTVSYSFQLVVLDI